MNTASPPSDRIRWRLLLILVAISLLLLGLDSLGYLSPITGYIRIPITAIQSWISGRVQTVESTLEGPRDIQALQTENRQLRHQIEELERQNEELTEIYAEYVILSTLMDYAKEDPEFRRVAADVIGWDTSNLVRMIIINRGSDDGIQEGMPVETERGLVGRVVEVGPRSSRVHLLTDPGSSVNTRLAASRADGTVVGQLTSHLRMKWIEQDIPITENELVMTSGAGGNFPPDLVVGRITRVEQSVSELFQEAEVRPAVDFERLEIVLIITNFVPAGLEPEPGPAE